MTRDGKVEEGSDTEKLTRALDTIVQVLVGSELESIRASVKSLESSLSEQIDSVKKEAAAAVDRVAKDLSTRKDELLRKLDEADERQKKSLDDLDQRARKTEAELRRQLQEFQTKTETRIQTIKDEANKNLAAKEDQLKRELGGLAGGLSAVQLELQQLMMKSDRISTLLDGMGSVLTGQPAAQPDSTCPVPGGIVTEDTLDNALEHVFQADLPPDKSADGPSSKKGSPATPEASTATQSSEKK
jgi:hypothetical protein